MGQEEDAAETVADAEVEVAFKMGVLTEEAAAFEEEEEAAIEVILKALLSQSSTIITIITRNLVVSIATEALRINCHRGS